ncbi:DUF1501 domain-containing protein [Paludisphaera soli]|uniref:DUF1501 domain-containing protein n=1 Tax=Paludisphaera soli TaxID=2712865 RepID=UPI0013EC186F|nr:DUF1501 domain-containing protein [Paludisphaera soli]
MRVSHQGSHPHVTRRTAVQAGAVGLLGLGMNHLQALRAATPRGGATGGTAKSCIYIFLSGGLAQHESFDMKPDAPEGIRGEFKPIATRTPGVEVCEHLPGLAARSDKWAVVRSLTHGTNDHTLGHYLMLTGRSKPDPGFRGDRQPRSTDWPCIASVVGDAMAARGHNLPPAVVLPERLIHWSGGVIPGGFGGQMGSHRDPFYVEASTYGNPFWRGAFPGYVFPNESKKPPQSPDDRVFQAPNLTLSPGMTLGRLNQRTDLLRELDRQRGSLEATATAERFDRHRQSAISLLASPEIRDAFDVTRADEKVQERYGKNSFGWSMLMALRLVEAGVSLVQVNLGSNETWDTHGDMFPRLKDKLFPPTDRALGALLDDLESRGLLDSTMIVMASEFGRTPKLSTLPESYETVGRDHWGAAQSVWFAGGGVRGGTVVGSTDKIGAYPASLPQSPENMAATIYKALGIPDTASWSDELDRPHLIYQGSPIPGLM